MNLYREAGVWVVDVNAGPWSATAVTSQHILTRSLEVKGPAIERVVVGVSKNCAYTWLLKVGQKEGTDEVIAETFKNWSDVRKQRQYPGFNVCLGKHSDELSALNVKCYDKLETRGCSLTDSDRRCFLW